MRNGMKPIFAAILATAAIATPALADDQQPPPAEPSDADTGKTEPPTAPAQLPPPKSDSDPQPPVASPDVALPPGGVVEQAGVGGTIGYGRAGVLELGGSAGLMIAPDFRNVNVAPSIGWFVADNLELSGILSVSNIKAGSESSTVFSALVEPSYHLPFNRTTFAFLGMGIGYAHITDVGGGLAVAPRIGANFLVGRSGVLTPSLSYEYTTHNVDSTPIGEMQDVTVVAVSSALRANIGYTVMW
jgi:hypothetical protein